MPPSLLSRALRHLPSVVLACGIMPCLAADLIVSQTQDSYDGLCDADCSLRDAISQAATLPGPQRIRLAAGTYTLSLPPARAGFEIVEENDNLNGDLDIRGDITLVGAGNGLTFIDAAQIDRILDVQPGAFFRLQRLTLRNGLSTGYGGALRNQGETILDQVNLLDNRVYAPEPAAGGGGAIANFFVLSLSNALLQNNHTHAEEPGHGQGGALYNTRQLKLRNSTLDNNSSSDGLDTGRGGALYNQGFADIARTTFTRNTLGEYGAGSAILNAEGGVLQLKNSTLSQNRAHYGQGALANGHAASNGNSGTQTLLVNVTLADNSGNNALSNWASLVVRNSLVAGNYYIPDEGPRRSSNCKHQGSYYLARGLLLGSDAGQCPADLPMDDSLTFTQVLEPLAANGASTFTHALRPASPALEAGLGTCTQTDERGIARPQDGNGDGVAGCDLGAYERAAP
ncbi:MAG: choice-of-anchor Q domain-containing protein [Pseudomonas sp.]|uniref:choice-of-anchor Q domain-containing protein n=1 Tax=Pseudomonas sp. TaxID=306 RepID=UPI003392C558